MFLLLHCQAALSGSTEGAVVLHHNTLTGSAAKTCISVDYMDRILNQLVSMAFMISLKIIILQKNKGSRDRDVNYCQISTSFIQWGVF